MADRIQVGATEPVTARFIDVNLDGITGLAPTVVIWRKDTGLFWTGTGYNAAPTNHAMAAVDATNLPGVYQYDFVATNGQVVEVEHGVLASANDDTAVNPETEGDVTVGQWVDDIDLPISTVNASVAALNDISVADILTAILGSGESVDVALSRLDNIDADVATNIPADIAALNDISVADILAAILTSGDDIDTALSRLLVIDGDTDSLRDHSEGRHRIDTVADPHQEVIHRRTGSRSGASGSELERYDIFDANGAPIDDANPMPTTPPSAFDRDEA